MPSQKNIDVVSVATEKFEKSSGIYFTKYTGMDVAKMTSLRKAFRDNSVEYSVIKNTLAKIASKNAGMDGGEAGVQSSDVLGDSSELTPELLDKLRRQYGLDKPIIVRYLIWLGFAKKLGFHKSLVLQKG